MANRLIRGIDDELAQRLHEQAPFHGRNAEAEHRAILVAAPSSPRKRTLARFLATMPKVGRDEDFVRPSDPNKPAHVFD